MSAEVDAIVVGAGAAGLSASYHLKQAGVPHVVLERETVASSWAVRRWDSFHVNTPNRFLRLPGAPYDGDEPDGFMARDELVARLRTYAKRQRLPVREGIDVTAARRDDTGWVLTTSHGPMRARAVIAAAGAFPKPKVPKLALDASIQALHTSQYRNAKALPPGAVLVVGSAQSGVQVADDLLDAGRRVLVAVGRCPRLPQRYRGRQIFDWMELVGILAQRPDDLPPPGRAACNPQLAARRDGPQLDVRSLAGRGATILGHFEGGTGTRLHFRDDVEATLRASDERSAGVLDAIDGYIAAHGLDAPRADPAARDFTLPAIDHRTVLDARQEGISTIVYATGYHLGVDWLDAPTDETGFPRQEAGVAPVPGLYYVGLHFMVNRASGLLYGVGEDARRVVARLVDDLGRA